MFKKTMTFDDLEGNPTTQTFYFNYDKIEIVKMLAFDQLEEKTNRLMTRQEEKGLTDIENTQEAYDIFEELIAGAYGVKSDDNLEFDKTPEMTRRWKRHVAFPELIFELLGDTTLASEFMEKCLPKRMVDEAKKELEKGEVEGYVPPVSPEPEPDREPSDEELLAMKPQDMTREQLMRAMRLKSAG